MDEQQHFAFALVDIVHVAVRCREEARSKGIFGRVDPVRFLELLQDIAPVLVPFWGPGGPQTSMPEEMASGFRTRSRRSASRYSPAVPVPALTDSGAHKSSIYHR